MICTTLTRICQLPWLAHDYSFVVSNQTKKLNTKIMKKMIKSIAALSIAAAISISGYAQKPSSELLNPTNHALVLIDHESQMGFAVKKYFN